MTLSSLYDLYPGFYNSTCDLLLLIHEEIIQQYKSDMVFLFHCHLSPSVTSQHRFQFILLQHHMVSLL